MKTWIVVLIHSDGTVVPHRAKAASPWPALGRLAKRYPDARLVGVRLAA